MESEETQPRTGNPVAIVLWVVVAAGLLYGVSQTVIKASALFTG